MRETLSPRTEPELVEAVQWALSADALLEIRGAGTKRALGRSTQTAATLDMRHFSGIAIYEPEELILEAGAATPLSEIEKALDQAGQQLAFEPPDHSRLLDASHAGTLGGVLACGLAGPRRIKAGSARDHVLGVSGVSGRGEAFKAGARVVKNVTGYDLPKLMAGSWGTLAALTTITMKVLPRPETESTLVLLGLNASEAVSAMCLAMQSACEVSGAAYLPRELAESIGFGQSATLLRLEGIAPSVGYRQTKLTALLPANATREILAESDSQQAWRTIRDVHPLCGSGDRALWRISVAPSKGAEVLDALPQGSGYLDWAGGLVWLDVPADTDAGAAAVRKAVGEGHATLFRANSQLRSSVAVFQPQPPALAALSARVKQAFDPHGILNPGRMYSGV